jgi:hypothetical protein
MARKIVFVTLAAVALAVGGLYSSERGVHAAVVRHTIHLDVTVGTAHMSGTVTEVNQPMREVAGGEQYRVELIVAGTPTITCGIAVANRLEADSLRAQLLNDKTTSVSCTTTLAEINSTVFYALVNTISPTSGDVLEIAAAP